MHQRRINSYWSHSQDWNCLFLLLVWRLIYWNWSYGVTFQETWPSTLIWTWRVIGERGGASSEERLWKWDAGGIKAVVTVLDTVLLGAAAEGKYAKEKKKSRGAESLSKDGRSFASTTKTTTCRRRVWSNNASTIKDWGCCCTLGVFLLLLCGIFRDETLN